MGMDRGQADTEALSRKDWRFCGGARRWVGACFVGALLVTGALMLENGSQDPGTTRIVLYGAESGTRLTLTAGESEIVADGYMAPTTPVGCALSRDRLNAICPTGGVTEIEILTGPNGDFVEVADPMPFPLTIHMGLGEDKFVGNAENDTCYPEGTRRNRCIGGAGDDVCITGPRNSDCIGGPGNDYCKTSTGSDGCWGGPGRDYCNMGPGEDGCHGEAGDDRLYGGPQPDQLYGGRGVDYCKGLPGVGRSHDCELGPDH